MEEERNRFEMWWVGNFAFGYAVDDAKFLQRRGYEYSHSDTNMMWKSWAAACAWQREQNAEDCERADVEHQSTTPAGAAMYCAKLIRGRVPNG